MVSLAFHTGFFPRLLIGQFRNDATASAGFVPSAYLEGTTALATAGAAIAVGASLLASVPLVGVTSVALGTAGLGYVLYTSIVGAIGIPPTYRKFLFGLFFLLLTLGADIGILVAIKDLWWVTMSFGTAGAAVGYWAGLLIGFHAQRLGFLATVMDQLAVAGTIGLFVVGVLMLLL